MLPQLGVSFSDFQPVSLSLSPKASRSGTVFHKETTSEVRKVHQQESGNEGQVFRRSQEVSLSLSTWKKLGGRFLESTSPRSYISRRRCKC